MIDQPLPAGFVWGAATASYQIEGAARDDGRAESIWDRFSHTPGHVIDADTGDIACDHYHHYREDVGLISELGLDAYRFSIAWPRVIPSGVGAVNQAGLDFYDRLVDALLEHGITPHATLYHWDLPQALEDAGGWPVRATATAFGEYAGVVAARLGDRIAYLATLNEPFCSSDQGYRKGTHAPGRRDHGAALAAAHHLLVGHALAIQAIRAEAPSLKAGIVLNFEPKHPASPNPLDVEAASVLHDQINRWFLDPIVGRGYPAAGVAAWRWDRREVLDRDMDLIASPIDFLGVNYYTRQVVRAVQLGSIDPPTPPVERTGMGWEVYPAGLTEVLEFVASRTGDLPLYVTENGAAYPLHDDPTDDPERVSYLRRHVEAALTARARGVPVHGYFAWSLMDNFEWAFGYSCRFGLVHVDFATLERRIRASGRYWAARGRSREPAGDAHAREAAR